MDPFPVLLFAVVLEADRTTVWQVGHVGVVDQFLAVENDGDVFFQDGDLEAVPASDWFVDAFFRGDSGFELCGGRWVLPHAIHFT